MNQDSMSSQLAALNRNGGAEKPKPAFIALFAIICTLLIAGIVAALVSASARKNPANIALEAVNHLLDAPSEPISISGNISIVPTKSTVTDETPRKTMEDGEENPQNFAGINLTINALTSLLPSKIDLDANLVIGEAEIPVKTSLVATETGKVYLNVDGLKTAIDGYLESLGITAKYFDHFDEFANISSLYGLIGTLEGSWWELDLGTDYANLVTQINAHAKNPQALKDAYAAHPFIVLSPAKDNQYILGIDSNHYQAVFGDLPSTAPDIAVTLDDRHRITHISAGIILEDYATTAELKLDYPASIVVEVPEKYKPVDNLFDALLDTIDY